MHWKPTSPWSLGHRKTVLYFLSIPMIQPLESLSNSSVSTWTHPKVNHHLATLKTMSALTSKPTACLSRTTDQTISRTYSSLGCSKSPLQPSWTPPQWSSSEVVRRFMSLFCYSFFLVNQFDCQIESGDFWTLFRLVSRIDNKKGPSTDMPCRRFLILITTQILKPSHPHKTIRMHHHHAEDMLNDTM
jgi:hypothetical protein